MHADQDFSKSQGRLKYTGKRLIVLRDAGSYQSVNDQAKDVSLRLASSMDYAKGLKGYHEAFREADGIVFERFGIAVVNETHDEQITSLTTSARSRETFLYSEPERFVYALDDKRLSWWQKIWAFFFSKRLTPIPVPDKLTYEDDATAYWGIHAVKAISARYTGKGVNLAILDTGFNLDHPDFEGRTINSESFINGEAVNDLNGHGTHCTGIAASGLNRQNGIRYGVAQGASIYIGKVLSNEGVGSDSSILAGLEWALINKCKVISMSLGASVTEGEGYSRIYNDLAKKLMDENILIIAAAGNDSKRSSGVVSPVSHPANCPNIMAVGALDKELSVADFSSAGINDEGGEVDIAAPGVDIFSSYKGPDNYEVFSGTSMATPFVAGLAALLWNEFPEASPTDIWTKLEQNALELQFPTRDVGSGLAQADN